MRNNLFNFLLSFLLSFSTTAFAKELLIGFPEDNMSNDWRAAQVKEIRLELAKHKNIRFISTDAEGSIAKNLFDIENMVQNGADLLFLGPKNPEAIAPLVSEIRKKGVKIVLLTRRLNTEDYDSYISPNDVQIGRDAAKLLAKTVNRNGRILMLEGVSTTTTALDRKRGFLAEMKRYKNIEVINRVADYSRVKAIAVMEDIILSGEKVDAVYAHNDAMASGVRFALKAHNIDPSTIPTVGIDFLPETRDAIRNGEQLASFTYPTCGKVGVETAIRLLNGQKVKREISVPSVLVTKDNVDSVKTVYD